MLLVCLLALQAAGPLAAAQVRGVWVVRTGLVSAAAADKVVDDAVAAGLNTLLVQVRGRGDAFYRSRVVARSPLLATQPDAFDPLARLLERAHARGLAVHAWVNVLLAAHFAALPADNVVFLHPDWLMAPRAAARVSLPEDLRGQLWLVREKSRADPDVEGYYLSPSVPGVTAHLEAMVRELVRAYPVEGLHLDFIRYPGPEFDYSRAALEGFRRESPGGPLLESPEQRPAAWAAYRRERLTDLAARLARAAREERAGLTVSAAVVPDLATALHQKFQDWPRWIEMGTLDAVCPMTYTPDGRIFQEQLADARARAAGRPVWAGIGAYRMSVAEVLEKIEQARASGVPGFVLFSHESLDPLALKALRDASRSRADAPASPSVAR